MLLVLLLYNFTFSIEVSYFKFQNIIQQKVEFQQNIFSNASLLVQNSLENPIRLLNVTCQA